MLIDVHAHLNFHAYSKDRDEVIKKCQNMKVINIGSQYETSRLALELARKNENMFASVGLHPIHVGGQEEDENEMREKVGMSDKEQLVKIRELLESDTGNRIVAVGETGLDYFHFKTGKYSKDEIQKKQENIFVKHIELAHEFKKPLMLHCRGGKENPEQAYNNVLEILTSSIQATQASSVNGMIHCFSSSVAIAKRFLNLGFYVGFTGIITFPNAGDLVNVVREVPLNRILTETDSPYLAPQEVRGQRNEPRNVKYIAEEIAKIKEISYDEVISVVEQNSRNLFQI